MYVPLSGPIPSSIWRLSALKELRLDQNVLTGPLTPLDNALHADSVTPEIGAIEMTSLPDLRYLDVSRNAISGPLPPSLGEMTTLQEVYLYQNLFTGHIPPSLCELSHLSAIRLDSNRLTGAVHTCMHEMEALTVLGLGNNPLLENVHAMPSELDNEYVD